MSADSLAMALRDAGVDCAVESRDGLAIVIPAPGWSLPVDDEVRRHIVTLARAHGFTHVAVELIDGSTGAAVSRD